MLSTKKKKKKKKILYCVQITHCIAARLTAGLQVYIRQEKKNNEWKRMSFWNYFAGKRLRQGLPMWQFSVNEMS